jgi:hypothetical protein
MEIWWNSLDLFLKIMWGIAIAASIIFSIQMVMTFAGMDADGNLEDGGSEGDAPFQLFTFRNFINFFLGFSWTGERVKTRRAAPIPPSVFTGAQPLSGRCFKVMHS